MEALPYKCPERPSVFDPTHYGYYCGPEHRASCYNGKPWINPSDPNNYPAPWDDFDNACAYHDCCVGTVDQWLGRCTHKLCHVKSCLRLIKADCSKSRTLIQYEWFRVKASGMPCSNWGNDILFLFSVLRIRQLCQYFLLPILSHFEILIRIYRVDLYGFNNGCPKLQCRCMCPSREFRANALLRPNARRITRPNTKRFLK